MNLCNAEETEAASEEAFTLFNAGHWMHLTWELILLFLINYLNTKNKL